MKWHILSKFEIKDQILEILLKNRGIKSKKEIEEFLNPSSPYSLVPIALGIDQKQLAKALKRISRAIEEKEPVIVYGDYDVDGICATAIVWECLHQYTDKVMPFIPLREKEGYGLSVEGIKTIMTQEKYGISKSVTQSISNSVTNGKGGKKRGLIITVDSGIVAHEAVTFANDNNIDVIILDHHEKPKKLPEAQAIVHTTKLCAAGIAFMVANALANSSNQSWLELAAIATVADLVPLVGPNRSVVKHGLEALNTTERIGLKALYEVAGIKKVGTYEIGYLLGPRLNASGRIDSALVGLRLLCTRDQIKAKEYAQQLNEINRERQQLLEEMTQHAMVNYESGISLPARSAESRRAGKAGNYGNQRIIVLEHESYHQGVIGLIAGKLVEKYYLPAIVISKGETVSKASARSINGFNIIEAIRECDEYLLNAGGHPMAAGFSVETVKISNLKSQISKIARDRITDKMLERSLKIDCEISLDKLDLLDLLGQLEQLKPFGMGNPEPVFASEVTVDSVRTVGREGKHLKLVVRVDLRVDRQKGSPLHLDAISFGQGELSGRLQEGAKIKIAYNLVRDNFNGGDKVQLKVKDIGLQ